MFSLHLLGPLEFGEKYNFFLDGGPPLVDGLQALPALLVVDELVEVLFVPLLLSLEEKVNDNVHRLLGDEGKRPFEGV